MSYFSKLHVDIQDNNDISDNIDVTMADCIGCPYRQYNQDIKDFMCRCDNDDCKKEEIYEI